jgi:protein phosphatase
MGGHKGGQVAARLAVDTIYRFLQQEYIPDANEAIVNAIQAANDIIYNKSSENPELAGMGTTVVLSLRRGEKLYTAWVGDSRMYLFRWNRLLRETTDHTTVQKLVDDGLITETEALNHPRRHELLRAVGTQAKVVPQLTESAIRLMAGDRILICSDGICGYLPDTVIETVLASGENPNPQAEKLLELCYQNGGQDNATILLFHFNNTPSSFTIPITQQQVEMQQYRFTKTTIENTEAKETLPPDNFNTESDTDINDPDTVTIVIHKQKFLVVTASLLLGILLLMMVYSHYSKTNIANNTNTIADTREDSSETNKIPTSSIYNQPPAHANGIPHPDSSMLIEYKVRKGESLKKVAEKFLLSEEEIMEMNELTTKKLKPKQILRIRVWTVFAVNEPNIGFRELAQRFYGNIRYTKLLQKANRNKEKVNFGDTLYIPKPTPAMVAYINTQNQSNTTNTKSAPKTTILGVH